MTEQRKSQITMLMIIGLVIFIVVSLVLYLSKSSIKKQSQQNINNIQEVTIELQPIKEFIAKCLDKLAKDAIVVLGKQGGYIYKSQGGTLIDYRDTDDEGILYVNGKDSYGNNIYVSYNIMRPSFAKPTRQIDYSSDIPDYPWQIFPYKDTSFGENTFKGFFGISNMPPLNSSGGPNSMQTQIETFVDNNIASCADFSIFKKQGFDIVMSPPDTYVVIGASDVSVTSKIPITITNTVTNEFAEISDFSTNVKVRLHDIYFFTKNLIDKFSNLINFNLKICTSCGCKLIEGAYKKEICR